MKENEKEITNYFNEIMRIKNICYPNQGQLDTVIGTRHYINNHYDKELNLNFLSHIRFTSKFHLLRLFKRYYRLTPKQYLIDRRLEKSKELLASGQSITETCFDIGFESPSSFSTLFKSKFGLTPSEFQKRATFTKSKNI
jgi:AraC-like DNA-binding protein